MTQRDFIFFDYESSGINLDFDAVYQFASLETDKDLNVIEGSEKNIMARPRRDLVPHPKATMVHHISPKELSAQALNEYELAKTIQHYFLEVPGTGIGGYNTISYDDEMTRRLMYRNLRDPYEAEWKDGNFRFDIYKLVQAAYALRPDTLTWPTNDEGDVSLKLENLTAANGVDHGQAHDALSDVHATIGIGRKIKESSPGLWDYFLLMTQKAAVLSKLKAGKPLVHVNSLYGKDRKNASIILPIVGHKQNKNSVICVDLLRPIDELLAMSAEDIQYYAFSKREDLPESAPRPPTQTVAANKQPIIVDYDKIMKPELADRLDFDLDMARENEARILADKTLPLRLQKAFNGELRKKADRNAQIYCGGFLSRDDNRRMTRLHMKDDNGKYRLASEFNPSKLKDFQDKARIFELGTRCKWNTFLLDFLGPKATLPYSSIELLYYNAHIQNMLYGKGEDGNLTIEGFNEAARLLKMDEPLDDQGIKLMDELQSHVDLLEATAKRLKEVAGNPEVMKKAKAEYAGLDAETQKAFDELTTPIPGISKPATLAPEKAAEKAPEAESPQP